ncbi:TetR/AcrR family transcriptional regulator [Allostreptomyces psammosilenae]|uniref:AcrR family transcriptional regulator n=1 Tax=Allostreptomyces psammosilenae TaxID=1892865 RepID=A0A853A8G9_9ACTN|nr:TetR/AcrR family transcriptional regulator [Allostreptomyces psammosilenae]NYI06828.1 AcrR family transcriptional regulator [Allostreptomyces psammosilenae]
MPKLVDHDQRREELVRAVWEVISRDGIEGATVRKVAEEAGVSVGGLRHYFDSQRGLLLFAAQAIARNVGARVLAHVRRDGLAGPERARLMLEEFLPLDAWRRVELDVWLACLVRSRVDPSMAELRETSWVGERHVCRLAVAYCRDARPPEDIRAPLGDARLERWAARLHVYVDGLTLQAGMFPEQLPAEEVRRGLRRELELVVAG